MDGYMGPVYYCSCDQQDRQASQIDSKYCVLRFRHDYDKACHKCIPDETQQEQLSWSTAMYFVSKMVQKYSCSQVL